MNIQLPQTRNWTADQFLEWNDGREGKYESVRGKIVMTPGGTRGHAELCLALGAYLRPLALDAGFGVANG